jgi:hypothetical protein
MQEEKTLRAEPAPPEPTEQTAPPILTIRIGKTTYKVAIHFSNTSDETMGDKIARLVGTEAGNQSVATDAPTKPPPKEPVPQSGLTAGKENE